MKLNLKILLAIITTLAISSALALSGSLSPEAIAKRLAPIAKVKLNADTQNPTTPKPKKQKTGKEIYTANCQICHASGIAGAPKINNKKDWQSRLEQGMDKVLYNAVHGIRAMPPKGNCLDCTENDIKITIDYMLAKLK